MPGGVEGKEGVAAVGFELDAKGGKDEEGFCGWVRGALDGGADGRRGGGTGRPVEDLSEAGPEEECQCDHCNDADGERDMSLPYLGLRKNASAHCPTHDRATRTHATSTAPTSTTTSRDHPTAERRMRPLPSRARRQRSTRYSVKPCLWVMENSGYVGRGRRCVHSVSPASGFGRGKMG